MVRPVSAARTQSNAAASAMAEPIMQRSRNIQITISSYAGMRVSGLVSLYVYIRRGVIVENGMIIVIVIAIAGYGLYATIQHFRGQGGCCGGGGYKVRKKKLSGIKYQKTFQVEGMQ